MPIHKAWIWFSGTTGPAIITTAEGEAGVGVQQCPDDFLQLGGVRVCGSVLNDGSVDPKFTENAPVRGGIFNTKKVISKRKAFWHEKIKQTIIEYKDSYKINR